MFTITEYSNRPSGSSLCNRLTRPSKI
jgi:hypothetical protein